MRRRDPAAPAARTQRAPARTAWLALVLTGLVSVSCSGQLDYEPEEYKLGGATVPPAAPPAATPPAATPPAATPPASPPSGDPPPGGAPPTTPATPPAAGMTPPTGDPPPAATPPVAACAPGLDGLTILAQRCGTCHGERAPTKGLDLISPGVGKRLVNVRSTCMSLPYLPGTGDAATSYLIEKLDGPVAGCGGQMPFGAPPLSPEERSCLVDWSDKAMARESGR
jgi:hypothetical protein